MEDIKIGSKVMIITSDEGACVLTGTVETLNFKEERVGIRLPDNTYFGTSIFNVVVISNNEALEALNKALIKALSDHLDNKLITNI